MSVNLSPVGGAGAQFCDNNGNPLNGGKLYTYGAGTTTPAATYTSAAGSVFHTNPIVLNAGGRVPDSGEIWLADNISYKFVLKTSADVLIATWDNINGINSNFVNYTIQEEVITATAGQTVFDLSTITYAPGTNSLAVYIDGVNQIVTDSYVETDANTVTFVSGLHDGALVKFTTAVPATGTATTADVVSFTGFNGQFGVVQDLGDADGSDWVGFTQAGTGAVPRSAQDKMRDTISVKDFGAVGDGVTDDTAAIQSAIDSQGTGGVVYIPAGNYLVTSQINIPYSKFKLYGAGCFSTRIITNSVFNNSDGLVKLSGPGGPPTYLTDMCISGPFGGAGAASRGLNVAANGSFVKNVWVTSFFVNVTVGNTDVFILDSAIEEPISGGTGLQITSSAVTVANCVVYNCYNGISIPNVASNGGQIAISNVRTAACGANGFTIVNSSGIVISNCTASHNNTGRYVSSGINIDTSTDVSISNCSLRLESGPSTTSSGIKVTSSSKINITNVNAAGFLDGITSTSASITVVGGTYSDNGRRGISAIGGSRVTINATQCLNNGGVGTTDAGIYADNTAAGSFFIVSNNICTQTGGGAQEYGIYANVTSASGYTNLVGNICKVNGTAQISKNGFTANIGDTGNLV